NFDLQVVKTPDHVTVDVPALSVIFEQSVGSVQASALSDPVQLGHSTAVVAAIDANKHIDVQQDKNGNPVVVTTTAPSAVAPVPEPSTKRPGPPVSDSKRPPAAGQGHGVGPGTAGPTQPPTPSGVATTAPTGPNGSQVAPGPSIDPGSSSTTDAAQGLN